MNTDTHQNLVHIHNELVELQHTLRCPLCQYTMQSPAMLPCLHSFCHSCIVHYCQHNSSKNAKKMECPLCKDPFSSKRSIRKSSALQNIVNCVKGTIKAFGLAPFEYEENYLEMTQLPPASMDGDNDNDGDGGDATPRLKRSRLSKCHEHLTVSRAMQHALANHPHNQHNNNKNNPNDSKDCDKEEDRQKLSNNVTSDDAQEVFETQKKKMSRSSDHTTIANKKRRILATNSVSSKAMDDHLQEQQHQQKRNKYDRIVKEMDKVIQCDEKALVKAAVMIRRKSFEGKSNGRINHHRCLPSTTLKTAAAEKDAHVTADDADVFHDASSEEIATVIDGTMHSIEDRMGTGDVSNDHSWNNESEERYRPKKKQDANKTNKNNNDSNSNNSSQIINMTENFKESNARYVKHNEKENVITDTKHPNNNNNNNITSEIHQGDNNTGDVFLTSSSQDNDDEVEDDQHPKFKSNENNLLRENADYLSTIGPKQNPNVEYPTTIPNTLHHPTSSISTTTVKSPPPQPSKLLVASAPSISSQPHIPPRTIVHITSRTWPGCNKPGGVARIVSYCTHSDTYNVSYVLGGKEKCVPSQYVTVMTAVDATTDDDREQRKQRRGRVIARALQDVRNKENVHSNISGKKRGSTVSKKKNKVEQGMKKRKALVRGISKKQPVASKETLRQEATNELEEEGSKITMSKSKLRTVEKNTNPTSANANLTTTALKRYNQRLTKHRSRIEIISSGLSQEESNVLTKFIQMYKSKHKQFKISIATSFDLEKTTICFASAIENEDAMMARKRSFKAMRCMLAGVAILHVGYLRDCIMNNTYDFVEIQRKHCVDTLQTKCQDFLSIAKSGILRVAAAHVNESDNTRSILNRCLVLPCGTWNKINGSPKLSDVKQLLLDCGGEYMNDSSAFLRKVSSERKRSSYDRFLILCDESPELRLDDLDRISKVLQGSVVNTVSSSFLFESISSGMLLDVNMFPPKSANMLF